jgi:thiosulfate/3-mercaptopyruvate sulfurtransferase
MRRRNIMSDIAARGYANPDILVSTDWVASHLKDSSIRIIESNEDPLLYPSGHIPGAVQVDWTTDLNDPLRRDYLDKAGFEKLASRIGITNDTTVVFYGDKNNWWATYAFWVFHLFGHTKAKILDGGRLKWEKEGRELTRDVPEYPATSYKAPERDDTKIRAFRDQVLAHIKAAKPLVDVRSPGEYSGELLHMPNYPQEGALRGGHIPGAKNVPWSRAANPDDGTFKPASELKAIYEGEIGLSSDKDIVAYCRIGERSSHTWFVLTYLLGYPKVRNYDGSWTEWGNSVGVPIEK